MGKIISPNFSPVCGSGGWGGLVLERRWQIGRWRGFVGKGRERGGGEAARYGSTVGQEGRMRNRWRGCGLVLYCLLLIA